MLERLGGSLPTGPTPAGAEPVAPPAENETLLFSGKDTVGWEGVNSKFTIEEGILVANIEDGAYYINHRDRLSGDYTLSYQLRMR